MWHWFPINQFCVNDALDPCIATFWTHCAVVVFWHVKKKVTLCLFSYIHSLHVLPSNLPLLTVSVVWEKSAVNPCLRWPWPRLQVWMKGRIWNAVTVKSCVNARFSSFGFCQWWQAELSLHTCLAGYLVCICVTRLLLSKSSRVYLDHPLCIWTIPCVSGPPLSLQVLTSRVQGLL